MNASAALPGPWDRSFGGRRSRGDRSEVSGDFGGHAPRRGHPHGHQDTGEPPGVPQDAVPQDGWQPPFGPRRGRGRGRGGRSPFDRRDFAVQAMAGEHGERRRGGGRRGPGGPGGPGPFGFGPGGFDPRMFGRGFPPRGFGRGRRARKGDVRAGILALLAERPMNGYQVIQELGERSNGYWRPSPGSVYPALQQLEDEGLVRTTEVDGRKAYELTDEGRAHVEANAEQYAAPWNAMTGDVDDAAQDLASVGAQLGGAVVQVLQAGNDAQLAQAKQVLTEARRKLYRILAEDGEDAAPGAPADEQ